MLFLSMPLLALVSLHSHFPGACSATLHSTASSPSLSQALIPFVREALESQVLLARLSPENASLLRALVRSSSHPILMSFRLYTCKSYSYQSVYSSKEDPVFWKILIQNVFYRLAQTSRTQAEGLVNDLIIPQHPFFEELSGCFTTTDFFKRSFLGLGAFFEETIVPKFNTKFREILANQDIAAAETEFKDLLSKYRRTISWKYGAEKHACTFLANIGLKHVRLWATIANEGYDFYSDINDFAATVYGETLERGFLKDVRHAQKTLGYICNVHEQKNYHEIMGNHLEQAGEPTDVQKLQEYMRQALAIPQVYNSISHHSRAVMSKCQQHSPSVVAGACASFLEHICSYSTHSHMIFHKENYGYWEHLIQSSFVRFIQNEPEKARAILSQVIIPGSPPLISKSSALSNGAARLFDEQDPSDYMEFTEQTCKVYFSEKFSEILANTDGKEAQLQFAMLMHRYKQAMSYQYTSNKYHFTFLLNAGHEAFRAAAAQRTDGYDLFFTRPDLFAEKVYDVIAEDCQARAQSCLEKVLPHIYEKTTEKGYLRIIKAYVESGAEPFDVEHLRGALAEPPHQRGPLPHQHQSVLGALQQDSPDQEAFLCYIFCSYLLNSVELHDSPACFFRSLIYSSVFKFAEEHPKRAQDFLDQIMPVTENIPNTQSLEERCGIFAEDLLLGFNHQDRTPLEWVIDNGHAATVRHLAESGQPDPDLQNGNALVRAACRWNSKIFSYLMKAFEPDSWVASHALRRAVFYGNSEAVSTILKSGINVSTFAKHTAVILAARTGHTAALRALAECGFLNTHSNDFALTVMGQNSRISTVSFLLSHGGTFSTHSTDLLFSEASKEKGNIRLLRYLFVNRIFPSSYARHDAVLTAAIAGNAEILFYLMGDDTFPKEPTDSSKTFSENNKDLILLRAAERGHTAIVKHLIDTLFFAQSTKDCVLILAATGGYTEITEIVDCLIRSGVSSSAQDYALVEAARGGKGETVRLLVESGAIVSGLAKRIAIKHSTQSGHHKIAEYLSSGSVTFVEYPLDEELYQASVRGDAEVVERMLMCSKECALSTFAKEESLREAVGRNDGELVKCLMRRHAMLTDYAKDMAFKEAIEKGHNETALCLLNSGVEFSSFIKHVTLESVILCGEDAVLEDLLNLGVLFSEDANNDALTIACRERSGIAKLVIGINFAFADFAKDQALVLAARIGSDETLECLMRGSRLTFSACAKSHAVLAIRDRNSSRGINFLMEEGRIENISLMESITRLDDRSEDLSNFVCDALLKRNEVL